MQHSIDDFRHKLLVRLTPSLRLSEHPKLLKNRPPKLTLFIYKSPQFPKKLSMALLCRIQRSGEVVQPAEDVPDVLVCDVGVFVNWDVIAVKLSAKSPGKLTVRLTSKAFRVYMVG